MHCHRKVFGRHMGNRLRWLLSSQYGAPVRLHSTTSRHPVHIQGARLVYGRTSYTAQNAWIRNASVRDNILMGREA